MLNIFRRRTHSARQRVHSPSSCAVSSADMRRVPARNGSRCACAFLICEAPSATGGPRLYPRQTIAARTESTSLSSVLVHRARRLSFLDTISSTTPLCIQRTEVETLSISAASSLSVGVFFNFASSYPNAIISIPAIPPLIGRGTRRDGAGRSHLPRAT